MDFSRFLNDYLTIKRLRGVTPGKRTSEATFSPYFDRQFAVDQAFRKQDLAERAQTSKEKQQGEVLSWDKESTLAALAGTREMTLNRLAAGREISLNELAGRRYITEGELTGNRSIAMNRLATEKDITMGRLQTDRDISYSNLAWQQERAASSLDFDRWVQGLLKDQATIQDRNAVIRNVISTFGSLGNMYLMDKYYKNYGYRRYE